MPVTRAHAHEAVADLVARWTARLHRPFTRSAAVVVVGLGASGPGAAACLLLVLAWASIVPGRTVGARVLLAAVALTSLTMSWLLLMTSLGRGMSAPVLLVLLATVPFVHGGRQDRQATSTAGVVSACVTTLVVVGIALRMGTQQAVGHLNTLFEGEDHASHMSLLGGVRDAGTYLYDASSAQAEGIFTGLLQYPQALHATAGAVSHVARSAELTPAVLVEHYAAFAYVTFGIFTLAMSESGLALASRLAVTGKGLVLAGVVPVVVAWGGPFQSLLGLGFITQIGSLGALGALLVLSFDGRGCSPLWRLALAVAAVCVIAASWYLLLPVAVVPAAVCAWQERRYVREHRLRALGLLSLGAAAAVPHMLPSLFGGAASALNAPGGVVPLDPLLLACAALLPLLLAGVVRQSAAATSGWWSSWLAAILFSVSVGVYQLLTQGHVTYYYYKSTYTVLMLSTVAVAALLAVLATPPAAAVRAASPLSVVLVSAVMLVTTMWHAGTALTDHLFDDEQVVAWDVVLAVAPSRHERPILFWNQVSTGGDYLGNRLAGAIYRQDTQLRWHTVQASFTGQRDQDLDQFLAKTSARVITSSRGLRTRLSSQEAGTDARDVVLVVTSD